MTGTNSIPLLPQETGPLCGFLKNKPWNTLKKTAFTKNTDNSTARTINFENTKNPTST